MAKERTEKSCYESRFGAGWISASQYLAENMCARKARSQNNALAPLFWKDPYWEREFRLQLKHANELLETFSVEAIIKGLRHNDAKRIYSLGLKSVLVPLIRREQKQIEYQQDQLARQVQEQKDEEPIKLDYTVRKTFSTKRSKLQQLRDLDGEKES
jgi:hypothetical protein